MSLVCFPMIQNWIEAPPHTLIEAIAMVAYKLARQNVLHIIAHPVVHQRAAHHCKDCI